MKNQGHAEWAARRAEQGASRVTVWLDEATQRHLSAVAAKRRMTKAELVREGIWSLKLGEGEDVSDGEESWAGEFLGKGKRSGFERWRFTRESDGAGFNVEARPDELQAVAQRMMRAVRQHGLKPQHEQFRGKR